MREWMLSPDKKAGVPWTVLPEVGVAELCVLWAGDHRNVGSHLPGTRLLVYSCCHCLATSRASNHPWTSWPQETDILPAGKWKETGERAGSCATRSLESPAKAHLLHMQISLLMYLQERELPLLRETVKAPSDLDFPLCFTKECS